MITTGAPSGKSTLAKLLNGLLIPTTGTVEIDGRDTRDPANALFARRTVGLVFQNPDNQLVATIVEDDVAFGPENLGLPPDQIRDRVNESLRMVDMLEHKDEDPHNLSAGQRQKVAVAGILAMRPKYLVMDEPTSMLDPLGRHEILKTLKALRQSMSIGVIYITHIIEEAAEADRVLAMNGGKVEACGPPHKILSDQRLMERTSLYQTRPNILAKSLAEKGFPVNPTLLTVEEVVKELCSLKLEK
ncbi:MAG TPA: ATP-binding cassette domain-containing protein [Actinobacteria bacterium]|nr:ATP-binding cassette domain-containing protein [Actinomycetota bacterium]